jgi:hypothetical protein
VQVEGPAQHNRNVRSRLWLPTVAVLTLSGCVQITNEKALVGSYEWNTPVGKLSLDVQADHTYRELVEWNTGKSDRAEGRWFLKDVLKDMRIVFDDMICPESALRAYEDGFLKSTHPATAKVQCAFSPERHYLGPVLLVADPDNDAGFRHK